jgi:hypothetical protein
MRHATTRRKTAPRVRDGVVQKKNRWARSLDREDLLLGGTLTFAERAPGAGRRHVVSLVDVRRFLRCVPAECLVGLRAIVLGDGDVEDALGVYDRRGVITLCSWEDDLIVEWDRAFVDDHADTLRRLGTPLESLDADTVVAYFDERSARAFQLLHILLHELGHHRDRMARRSLEEDSAEAWAVAIEAQLWPRYKEWFGRTGVVRVA